MNINKDLETFIRIIRRLGRDLDAYDLRLDWTAVRSWEQLQEFRVEIGESVHVTQGLPLWQSTSLVGCGTCVDGLSC